MLDLDFRVSTPCLAVAACPDTVLLNRVQEETLNPSLVQNDLLKAAYARDRIRNAIAALDNAALIGVPETDLEHVVGFDPGAVAEGEGVEDF